MFINRVVYDNIIWIRSYQRLHHTIKITDIPIVLTRSNSVIISGARDRFREKEPFSRFQFFNLYIL